MMTVKIKRGRYQVETGKGEFPVFLLGDCISHTNRHTWMPNSAMNRIGIDTLIFLVLSLVK